MALKQPPTAKVSVVLGEGVQECVSCAAPSLLCWECVVGCSACPPAYAKSDTRRTRGRKQQPSVKSEKETEIWKGNAVARAVFHWLLVSCSVVDGSVEGEEPCLRKCWACLARGNDGCSVSTLPIPCARKDSRIGTVWKCKGRLYRSAFCIIPHTLCSS